MVFSSPEDLLASKSPEIHLEAADIPIFVECLKKVVDEDQSEKVMKIVQVIQPLPTNGDYAALHELLLEKEKHELNLDLPLRGLVKKWMVAKAGNGQKEILVFWSHLIRILGITLHQAGPGTKLLNSLLHVVEKAFKHPMSDLRVAGYKGWMALMRNFALNHDVLATTRRIKLIVRPLLGSISNRTEEQVQLKFDTWWYYFGLLGSSLADNIDIVVIPFLQFCFSSTVTEAKPSQAPQSPAKKFSKLRKKCLEAMAIFMCGLNSVKVHSLDISQFKPECFQRGIFKSEDCVKHFSTILQCVTDIYETLQFTSQIESEQFTSIIEALGALMEKVNKKQDPNQAAIGHYLDMMLNLLIVKESNQFDFCILEQVSKIPKESLNSSSIWQFEKMTRKESPALTMLEQMLNNDLMNEQSKYFTILDKFVQAACLDQKGLDVIENTLSKIVKKNLNDKFEFWRVFVHAYLSYVNKFNEVHQRDSKSTLSPNLSASFTLLAFPIQHCLNSNPKSKVWKLWTEAFNKFNEKAPLLVSYDTLKIEEFIAEEVLKKLDHDINETSWTNVCQVFLSELLKAIPYQSLSQESSQGCGGTEANPLGRLTKIFEVLKKLIDLIPKFKQNKETSTTLVSQLTQVLSQVSSQSLQRPLLKLLSPAFEVLLSEECIHGLGLNFETKAKNAHDIVINRLQSRYEGQFDVDLLQDLKGFLRVSLGHKKKDIRNKTHQMWQLTFSSSLKETEIPNEFKDLLKNSEIIQDSSSLGLGSQENFVAPLTFSNFLKKETKSKVSEQKPEKKTVYKSIDEENSQDFVKISSPLNKKRPLTEHQKEVLSKRNDDIPALYSEMSIDGSRDMSLFQSQSLTNSQDIEMSQENEQQENEKEEDSSRPKRKGTKPKKIDSPVVKKKRGRPPKAEKIEKKATQGKKRKASPLSINEKAVSEVNSHMITDPEVQLSRLSPTHLELTKGSPVKIITEDPLVIQPILMNLDNHDDEIIESSQPSEEETKKKAKKGTRRHSIDQPEKRPIRKAAQKLNLTVQEEPSKPLGKENEGPSSLKSLKVKVKTNKYGESPLHVAIKKGDLDKAKTLITEGADVNMKDHAGWTPLHEASAHYGSQASEILELLVKNGADVNAKANNGSTPLHDAVLFLPEPCIEYLIDQGANLDIENEDGRTPRSLIPEDKRRKILQEDHEENNEKMEVEDDKINDQEEDKLNDSTNSVLATPLEDSITEDEPMLTSVPNSQEDEIPTQDISSSQSSQIEDENPSQEIVEGNEEEEPSSSLIKPPLPVFKTKPPVLSNVFSSSRGARLLKMSKEKSSSPSSSISSSDGLSQALMSPRPELSKSLSLTGTPTQPKKEAWQKFVPSPCDASPSASILKRSASLDVAKEPPLKRRRVQFTDPPVSDQVVIPRCPSGKATRQKLQESKFNKEMFLSVVAKDLSKIEQDPDSNGLYEATPPLDNDQVPNNCIYPTLIDCDEPVTSILHNLTTKTWHKAAEKSLKDAGIETIADLSKLTAVKASHLKSLKPPNNIVTIKEALRKFEKSWIKRGKDKYTEKKILNSPPNAIEDMEANVEEVKEQSPTAAPVLHEQSTPEEEDEAMKEIYERPSPSPTESIELKETESYLKDSENDLKEPESEPKEPEDDPKEPENDLKESEDDLKESNDIDMPQMDVQDPHEDAEEIVNKVEFAEIGTETEKLVSNDQSVETEKIKVSDASIETEEMDTSETEQQTEEISAKDKMADFLKVVDLLDIGDLTEVISRAAKAIKDKSFVN